MEKQIKNGRLTIIIIVTKRGELPKLITYVLIRPYWGLTEQYNSSNSL